MKQLNGYKINNWFDEPLDLGGVKLIQAGRYFCEPQAVIPVRLHSDFYELTIVTEGKGTILTNDREIEVKKNDVYVSFPYDKHGIISSQNAPLKYDHLAFSVVNEIYAEALKKIEEPFYDPHLRIISDGNINFLAYCVLGEFNNKRPFSHEVILNAIYNIIVYIVRDFNEKQTPDFFSSASAAEIFCNRIMNYIDANVFEIENLKSLAKITNYNYNYISTLFKQTTGTSLRDYFVNRKLEVADMLFKEENARVWQVAERLHYSSGNALTKAYKKKFGVSPKTK